MKILRRNLSLMLAVRYLNPLRTMFSIITLICLGGVALGVMVLIVVLSVMEGLQKEMEERVLAFAPHYVVSQHDSARRVCISDEQVDWYAALDKIRTIPGIVAAYPQLEGDAFVQSDVGRRTVRFTALEPHNEGQVSGLAPMLRQGTFDFGEGLDQECVVSLPLANSLGLGLGSQLHLTPVGSLDEVASIYAMIQNPLLTQSDKEFMENISTLFDGAEAFEENLCVETAKLDAIVSRILAFDPSKLRQSEKDALRRLYEVAARHLQGGAILQMPGEQAEIQPSPFSPEDQKSWNEAVADIAALDRDREDGKAVKSINEMVMPVDLRVVGIYQSPENMPGPDVYMPLAIAQEVLGYSRGGASQVQGLCMRVEDPNNPGDIPSAIAAALPPAPEASEQYPAGLHWSLTAWSSNFEQWYKLIANERVMMSFVLSIISLIASFCIMAVMFTMSMQRKREIAVLQAMGATPWAIMRIFLWQGIIIGIVGAILGVLLALLVLYYRLEIQAFLAGIGLDPFPMQAHGIELPAVYKVSIFAEQAVKAFFMVTIAAIVPAFIVSRQDPSKALRSN